MATLFDAALAVAELFPGFREGAATGGSTTEIEDTDRPEGDDYFNNGTAFIIAAGAAAPEDEMRRISDFANTGGVVTVDDAFSATVAADDTYGLLPGIAPDILKAKINTVVRKFQYEQWDITSLDTVSGQTVYTLPAAIPAKTLISVKIQTNNDDADDPQWVDVPNWKPKTAAAGSQDEVILPGGLTSSRNLALVYAKKHPRLTADDSEIHQSIPLERIIYKAAANLMKDKLYDNDGKDNIAALINDLEEQNREMQARFPVGVSLRDSKVMDPW